MDSPQSVVTPFKNFIVSGNDPGEERSEFSIRGSFTQQSNGTSKNNCVKINTLKNPKDFIGTLDVFVHRARDIQNICIYHKQDVYAKLCLTNDPETTISTQTIHGGGRNPVFNENIQLNVTTLESSLKFEIWMLSRVRNYLEDQLLGFTLVPLSEIFIKNGKLEREFTLSSTDLFHTPSGFVRMSLSYSGHSPEVMEITKLPLNDRNSESLECVHSDLDKIEFPDPAIVKETQMMISEYFGMSLESQTTETRGSPDTEGHELGVRIVECFSASSEESKCSGSNNGSSCVTSISPSEEHVSPLKDKIVDGEGERISLNGAHKPGKDPIITRISVNMEPEEKMVQNDFVDMYMKSMQQFTESLAKMKLPMDDMPEHTDLGNSNSDQKSETPKSHGRVFYGSRAFF